LPATPVAGYNSNGQSLKGVSLHDTAPVAVTATERTANPLRPAYLNEMIGQVKVRRLLRRVIDATTLRAQPLDHVLLVAASGIGKSTVANIIANELGVSCYQVQAPISTETLMELRS
jgi:Holliday junction resolvasome RuvABC ATP-dependent DNA helicase subunit